MIEAVSGPRGDASETSLGVASASTVRFYDALSIVFFVAAAASLAFLGLYLITYFVVIALGAMDIGTILNATSRMIALPRVGGGIREKKARSNVPPFPVIRHACYRLAFLVFAVGVVH